MAFLDFWHPVFISLLYFPFRYDCQGQLVEPFLIGICGGSASGKTTVADKIIKVTKEHFK